NITVQLTSLSGGELGLEAPGHIWIDPTAAGWGWTLTGGQMDLSTVLTHEMGHALGFAHEDGGVMGASLAPVARLVPEAARSSVATPAAVPGGTSMLSSLYSVPIAAMDVTATGRAATWVTAPTPDGEGVSRATSILPSV